VNGPPFTHLHVASGYSLRYGASSPAALVEAAAEHGMDALALTDRDGLYGAVKFAQACSAAGIAPLLGVDLAVEPTGIVAGIPGWASGATGPWADDAGAHGGPGSPGPRGSAGRSGGGGAGGGGAGGRGAGGRGAGGRGAGPGGGAAGRGRRVPVRGGAAVDPRLPRVTVLALGADKAAGLPVAAGWARLCRLVTATHLRGERGRPVSTLDLIAAHAHHTGTPAAPAAPAAPADLPGKPPGTDATTPAPVPSPRPADRSIPALAVLLGPASELGRAVLARRADLARAVLDRWRAALPPGALAVEVVLHRGPEGTPGSLGHAARMLALAREAGVPAVITNAVRYATPEGAVTVDVLDAARRLVALDTRHLDRTTSEGYLAPPGEMAARAAEVARAAGDDGLGTHGTHGTHAGDAARLLADTEALARRCHLDPDADLGLHNFSLPEPEVFGLKPGDDAFAALRRRCLAAIPTRYPDHSMADAVHTRLEEELRTVETLGIPAYFLTVAAVVDLIKDRGIRVAARGSGAGSLVNHLLGISAVDPLRHGLLMERFASPLRAQLPDIDVDVESARRTEAYEAILEKFGGERVTCVSMMDTYRVRHAVRDVGAALGLPPAEIDTIATSFPHIRARDVRHALAELPELRASGLASSRLDLLFDLVEQLDGLPRHVALHPCGVVLSDTSLLGRTPVEASWVGFPMSQFDKDDVEALGLLKLDVLGIRMQSAMAYAVDEVARVDGPDARKTGEHPDDATYLDADGRIDLDAVPFDDPATYGLVRTTHTLGCFQIESPGQRELVGKFAPETFDDLIVDISLFRPGPVKSDMVTPFLQARQGWTEPEYLHDRLKDALRETYGVVVFHEQVLKIVSETLGCDLAHADEVRRALGSPAGQAELEPQFLRHAQLNGFDEASAQRIWTVLKAFASFGFCKAHAAAFAVPTYQSAWLKAHHPAAFLAGVLTHDPGMYPKRLILDDARNLGISVLPLDVNVSDEGYRVERVDVGHPGVPPEVVDDALGASPGEAWADVLGDVLGEERERPAAGLPDGRPYGIRLSLSDVKGISEAEVARIVAARPYHSLADFWHRAQVSRPVVERLVLAGAFDSLYGLGGTLQIARRDRVTRRDLLLQLGELERWTRATRPGRSARPRRSGDAAGAGTPGEVWGTPAWVAPDAPSPAALAAASSAALAFLPATNPATNPHTGGSPPQPADPGSPVPTGIAVASQVRAAAARQSQAARPVVASAEQPVQLALDLGDAPDETLRSGLPEMTAAERVRAELDVLGLDASRHVLDFYVPMLEDLGVTRARDVRSRRNRAELLVAGVKVATQTPPIRSGRRVVFLTLDDATGPVDATFFEDVQGPFAATVFHSWLLVVRGILRRTGPQGASLRATGAWELPQLWNLWTEGGADLVRSVLAEPTGSPATDAAIAGAAASYAVRPVMARPPVSEFGGGFIVTEEHEAEHEAATEAATGLPRGDRAGGMGGGSGRRVLLHPSGFRQSPYADIKPPGEDTKDTRRMLAAEEASDQDPELRRRRDPPRKLWHASPGSSGR
jgi:error-prone DNA polymerase